MKTNVVGWFEIPVLDMDRAVKFYNTMLNYKIEAQQFGDEIMAWFPYQEGLEGASGTLVYHEDNRYIPSDKGVTIYIASPSEDINNELARVEIAGGKVLQPKTLIEENYGYFALILDTEGNRIGLHSLK